MEEENLQPTEQRKKVISIMVPTYNEVENVEPLAAAIIEEFARSLPQYDYEILFIDNDSRDGTRQKLEGLCAGNPRIRAIFNARNFGQFNSPYYGICQTSGDCTIPLCADFQDPIEVIPRLVAEWEAGAKIVCAVKKTSREGKFIRFLRTCYYKLIHRMSEVEQIEHFTGFGLYDRSFVDVLRSLDDPTPFIRGIIAELGFRRVEIDYEQAQRRAGKTSNNFARLYDAAMLSFTTYTKTVVRVMTFLGLFLFGCSLAGGVVCFVLGARGVAVGLAWLAPVIGIFGSLNLFFLGMIGEYILTLRGKIMRRPLVIEERRINF